MNTGLDAGFPWKNGYPGMEKAMSARMVAHRQSPSAALLMRLIGSVLLVLLSAALLAPAAFAEEVAGPGWYDGWFDDGCSHYWDGSDWTGAIDCDGNGVHDGDEGATAGPGWYDGWFGDGCWHYWDGADWTGAVDCDGNGVNDGDEGAVGGPGWYDGWFEDGCWHFWDGANWTGAIDCRNRAGSGDGGADGPSADPGWYDGWFGDGCWHYWDGTHWTGAIDCNGNRVSDPDETRSGEATQPDQGQGVESGNTASGDRSGSRL